MNISWDESKEDNTCIVCGAELENDVLETLGDLRYNSQGFAEYECLVCHSKLSIQEEEITIYHVRRVLP
jgi:hypothetical protein